MTSNQLAYWNLQETKRTNEAKEAEANRSNVAKETETNRHNLVNEYIDQIKAMNSPLGLVNTFGNENNPITKLVEFFNKGAGLPGYDSDLNYDKAPSMRPLFGSKSPFEGVKDWFVDTSSSMNQWFANLFN